MLLPAWLSVFFPAKVKKMVGEGESCGLVVVVPSIA